MRLQLKTWPEVEEYLKKNEGIILPIGATEQHGPIGLIGTDAICAETLAWEVGERANALVAPTLAVGMSEHHMTFPGSMTLRPSILLAVVHDVVLSLARHGFRRFWFLNGHGGNTATLEAAFSEIYADVPHYVDKADNIRCTSISWWETPAAERLSAELFGDQDGDHATASEVSVALAAYPEGVKLDSALPRANPTSAIYTCSDFRRRYPDGRMGSDPTLATAEHGRTIRDAVVSDLAERYVSFMSQE
ncbi:MAG: creatininase family protein [bacterium]|nr:creatininase family protein [bacterium]